MLFSFSDYKAVEHDAISGGKGKTLARLFNMGYPIPDGFIILPEAFTEEGIKPEAWKLVYKQYQKMLNTASENGQTLRKFAVRSSTLLEDSDSVSYAGKFDSILNVDSALNLRKSIGTVYQSLRNDRALRYSQSQHIEMKDQMAIVVQNMVDAELAGVLFTVDPVQNNKELMKGNLVKGIGEKLMSGEANPIEFSYQRENGHYQGPEIFKPYSKTLMNMAERLEKDLSGPQDIEWAVSCGQLFILQSRPITTLSDQYSDYSEQLIGDDYLWTRTNIGEAYGDVLTPLTWSMYKKDNLNAKKTPGKHPVLRLISGRIYMNISVHITMLRKFGFTQNRALNELSSVLGKVPENLTIAPVELSRKEIYLTTILNLISDIGFSIKEAKALKALNEKNIDLCKDSVCFIKKCKSAPLLISRFEDHAKDIVQTFEFLSMNANRFFSCHAKLKSLLAQCVDLEDAEILLSGFGGDEQLESLGPLIGISKLAKGVMKRPAFITQYGHRCTNELELSAPRNDEETDWIDKLIDLYRHNRNKVDALLEEQKIEREQAWLRLSIDYPSGYRKCKKLYDKCSKWAQRRELIRSELVRKISVSRQYFMKIAELYCLGDDIFFLTIDEIKKLIENSDQTVISVISMRKRVYRYYHNLPLPPPVISGEYKPQSKIEIQNNDRITGFPGAVGIVEGKVRVLKNFKQANSLIEGEIIVASTTNVGWTPLFPIASAIVTDIGAPLSHAAIVARELGIPAVVGTGDGTLKLTTGDFVRVDGAMGMVEIIRKKAGKAGGISEALTIEKNQAKPMRPQTSMITI